MIHEFTINKTGEAAREALKKGADKVAEIISTTLGPAGKNVIIERSGLGWGRTGAPKIINDGYYTAQRIVLEDETENLGAQSIIDVAVKQNEMVGDGTTTSIVLAHAIIDKVFRMLKQEALSVDVKENTSQLAKKIGESCKAIVAKIKEMAIPIKTKEDMENVAIISLEDEKLGKVVGDMVYKTGKDGFVNVEESEGTEVKTDIIPGMKFSGSYIDDGLATNNRKEAILKEPHILVYNGRIEEQATIKALAEWFIKNNKRELVIICDGYSKEIPAQLLYNWTKKVFYCLAVKAPSLTTEQFEDIAVYTGAKFIDKNQGMGIEHLDWSDIGKADKIVVNQDDVFIIKGRGIEEKIKERVEKLKEQRDAEKVEPFKKKIDRRIASLSGGVGLIEVAANTEGERDYIIGKVEDAVAACKAAMEEGVVKGGGFALKEIDDNLPDEDILKETISAPYNKIKETAGDIDLTSKIIDPAKVIRVALENACSFAKTFVNINGSIAWKKSKLADELGDALMEKNK